MGKVLSDKDCIFTAGGISLLAFLLLFVIFQVQNFMFLSGMITLVCSTMALFVMYYKQTLAEARASVKQLGQDKRGIIIQGVIAIVFITASTLLWLICALILNKVADSMSSYAGANPHVALISDNTVNTFGIVIVVVDVLFMVWWATSAFRKERQELPGGIFPY